MTACREYLTPVRRQAHPITAAAKTMIGNGTLKGRSRGMRRPRARPSPIFQGALADPDDRLEDDASTAAFSPKNRDRIKSMAVGA